MTQHATKWNPEEPKPTSHHCRKPSHNAAQCRRLRRDKDQIENNNSIGKNNNINFKNINKTENNSGKIFKKPNNNDDANKSKTNNAKNRDDTLPKTIYPPCRTWRKTNHCTEKCFLWLVQQTKCLLDIVDQQDRIRTNGRTLNTTWKKLPRLRPRL